MIIFEEYVGVNPFAIAPGSQQPKPVKVWRVLLGNNEFGHDEADDVSIFLFPLTLHMTVLADFDLVFSYAGSQGKYRIATEAATPGTAAGEPEATLSNDNKEIWIRAERKTQCYLRPFFHSGAGECICGSSSNLRPRCPGSSGEKGRTEKSRSARKHVIPRKYKDT